jgi:hypothetical protein
VFCGFAAYSAYLRLIRGPERIEAGLNEQSLAAELPVTTTQATKMVDLPPV